MNQFIQDLTNFAVDNELLDGFTANSIATTPSFANTLAAALQKHPPQNSATDEVVILAFLLDDSGSTASPLKDAKTGRPLSEQTYEMIIQLHNRILNELRTSRLSDTVLVYTNRLNLGCINAFAPLEDAILLDSTNHYPNDATPLYDKTQEMYAALMLKAAEFMAFSRRVRIISLVLTDGADMGSSISLKDCYNTVYPILSSNKEQAVPVIGIGVVLDNGTIQNPVSILENMGFEDVRGYVLTRQDILEFCQTMSASFVRASQSATGFSAVASNPFATGGAVP